MGNHTSRDSHTPTPTTPSSRRSRARTLPILNHFFGKNDSKVNRVERQTTPNKNTITAPTDTTAAVKDRSSLRDGNDLLDKSFKETNMVKMGKDEEGNKMVNEYSVIRTLGSGSYGKVKLAMDSNNKAYVCFTCYSVIDVLFHSMFHHINNIIFHTNNKHICYIYFRQLKL